MSKRKNLYTANEVMAILSISRRTLTRWLASGRIEAVEIPSPTGDVRGMRYRFRLSELRRLGYDPDQNGRQE